MSGTAILTIQSGSFKSGRADKVVPWWTARRWLFVKSKKLPYELFSSLCKEYFSYNTQDFHNAVGQDPVTTHPIITGSGSMVMWPGSCDHHVNTQISLGYHLILAYFFIRPRKVFIKKNSIIDFFILVIFWHLQGMGKIPHKSLCPVVYSICSVTAHIWGVLHRFWIDFHVSTLKWKIFDFIHPAFVLVNQPSYVSYIWSAIMPQYVYDMVARVTHFLGYGPLKYLKPWYYAFKACF